MAAGRASAAVFTGARSAGRALGPALPFTISLVGTVLWALSVEPVDPRQMSGIGLISAIPVLTLVAMAAHVVGFMLAVFDERPRPGLLFVQLVTWIFMLHGFNAVVAAEPVFSVAWRHAGITDYILSNQGVNPNLDAYFSWPGFFALSALATKVADLSGPVALIRWAPPFFNLLYLAPMTILFRSAVGDARIVWLGLWLFYTANWISQDYFSPQAYAYFAYLLIMATLLKWFVPARPKSSILDALATRWRFLQPGRRTLCDETGAGDPTSEEGSPTGKAAHRVGAAATVILAFAAIVPSHQLTPFVVLLGVSLLVLARQLTLRGLPILMGVLLAVWISYMTVNFLAGHFSYAFNPVGLGESASVNVEGRMQGSPEHLVVVYVRLATTALVWGLAAWGVVAARGFRNWLAVAILLVAPFPLLLLQPYGGEMLLRVYLMALPFCALFIAALLTLKTGGGRRNLTTGLVASLLGIAFLGGFLISRYGNQTLDMVTTEEVRAVAHLYEIAPAGSLLLAADANVPWKYQHYGTYRYKTLRDYKLDFSSRETLEVSLAGVMQDRGISPSFLLLTRSQREAVTLLGEPAPARHPHRTSLSGAGWLDEVEQTLELSARFEPVFTNPDATIYVLTE